MWSEWTPRQAVHKFKRNLGDKGLGTFTQHIYMYMYTYTYIFFEGKKMGEEGKKVQISKLYNK